MAYKADKRVKKVDRGQGYVNGKSYIGDNAQAITDIVGGNYILFLNAI
jgi:hypothetical protein